MASYRPGATLVVSSAIALAGLAACGSGSTSNPTSPSKVGAGTTFSLTGNVSDSTTGSGITAATVTIAGGPNAGKAATTDASGAYVFSALQPSTFTIRASATNYLAQSKSLDLTGQQTLAFQLSRPAVFVGAKYDTIETAHQILLGIPTPTQNQSVTYCCWPFPTRNTGSYTLDLAEFPLGVLPSGGTSNIISASEMIVVGLNVSPAAGVMRFEWHRAVGTDTVIFTATGQPSWTWMYTYIGHFSWEINDQGSYYLVIDSPWGSTRLDFLVTNSAASGVNRPNDSAPFLLQRSNGVSPTGGFGGGRASIPY